MDLKKSAKILKNILSTFAAVPNTWWVYNHKKPAKTNSNNANNFSSDLGKQLLIANYRNRARRAVIGLSQDGACTNLFENFREK
jgi:hypothetical protein